MCTLKARKVAVIVHLIILFLLCPVVHPTGKLGDKWRVPFEVGHPNFKVPSPHFQTTP